MTVWFQVEAIAEDGFPCAIRARWETEHRLQIEFAHRSRRGQWQGSLDEQQAIFEGDEAPRAVWVEAFRRIESLGYSRITVNGQVFSAAQWRQWEQQITQAQVQAIVQQIDALFQPQTVAVIGASRERNTLSGRLFFNLIEYGFHDTVYPVNPKTHSVQGVRAYKSILDIDEDIDLAIITVPARIVLPVVQECVSKPVKALSIITAGFGEVSTEGKQIEAQILELCHRHGVRLIGPNCMGVDNTDEAVRLHATFLAKVPPPGQTAFLSQSGSIGAVLMEYAGDYRTGISSFVSVGNKIDLTTADFLHWWQQDPRTQQVMLYLEEVDQPQRLRRVATEVAHQKPIIVLKGGRTRAGRRATSSHTGALLQSSDRTEKAFWRQSRMIEAGSLEEFFEIESLLARRRSTDYGQGRVAIITNGGGPGILAADACEQYGLQVPVLSEATQQRLRTFLPPQAAVANPVDMVASATADDYYQALKVCAQDPNVDVLLPIFIVPLVTRTADVANAILRAYQEIDKPIVSVFMDGDGVPEWVIDMGIPAFAYPENAVRALSKLYHYQQWCQRPWRPVARPEGIQARQVAALLAKASPGWQDAETVYQILTAYGIPMVRQWKVQRIEELQALDLTFPVVLKAEAEGLVHKSEAGAVQLDIQDKKSLVEAAERMQERLSQAGWQVQGWIVQQQAPEGLEVLVGAAEDALGHAVMVGAGGTLVELMEDVSLRLVPLEEYDVEEMIEELRIARLLKGYRDHPALDIAAVKDILIRIATLVLDFPVIKELDLNPIFVYPQGALVVDARLRLGEI